MFSFIHKNTCVLVICIASSCALLLVNKSGEHPTQSFCLRRDHPCASASCVTLRLCLLMDTPVTLLLLNFGAP